MKRKYLLLIALVLAVSTVVGSYFLIMNLVTPSVYYQSTTQFNKGQFIDASDSNVESYFVKKTIYSKLPFDAITNLDQMLNSYVVSDLPPGTVLTKNLFSKSENVSSVREGFTHLSIQVDSYMSVEEGDVVNLVGSFTDSYGITNAKLLAQNVRCIGVYNKSSKSIKVIKNSNAANYEDLSPFKVILETPIDLQLIAEQYDKLYVYAVNPNDKSILPEEYIRIMENTEPSTEAEVGNEN